MNLEKKPKIALRVREMRRKLNLTQLELAEKIGATKQNISDLEKGKIKASRKIFELSSALGVPISYLVGETDEIEMNEKININSHSSMLVPLIQWRDLIKLDSGKSSDIKSNVSKWIACPVQHSEKAFAIKVKGDSMLPDFREGDIIFCDPEILPNSQDLVIAKPSSLKLPIFRRLIESEQGNYQLKASNSLASERYIEIESESQIIGKVTSQTRIF